MRQTDKIGILMLAAFAAIILTIAGCASAPLRSEASTSEIRAAGEVGAADVPQASLHLQFAKEELEQAQELNKNGEEEEAASMLMRAEADAELAVALSRGDAERVKANEAMERVWQLRRDNQ